MTNYVDYTTAYPPCRDINHNETYCLKRLPCGYCQLLKQVCPLQGYVLMAWGGTSGTVTEDEE